MRKERGIKKALNSVFDTIKENNWNLDGKVVGINHITDVDHLEVLKGMVNKEYDVLELIRGEVGSVVATHGGPGAVAIHFEK